MAEIIQIFCELLGMLLVMLFWIVRGSITILAYAVSPRYRLKKRQEWTNKPARKYLELGISGACLGILIALALWLSWPAQKRERERDAIRVREHQLNGDVRLRINTVGTHGATNDFTIAIKKGAR